MHFIENLTKILKEKNTTQYKLAKMLNIKPNNISNWKKGALPSLEVFWNICLILDVKPNDLLN